MDTYHDRPNIVYRNIGECIYKLASIGATDKELKALFAKGKKITLLDIADIEVAHTHYRDNGGEVDHNA